MQSTVARNCISNQNEIFEGVGHFLAIFLKASLDQKAWLERPVWGTRRIDVI
ncbi:hypothetical protein scyTo_0019664, partial [Scyliorhinus torazame]|nr:hypothetical protein [Scyliorhinus torazame]